MRRHPLENRYYQETKPRDSQRLKVYRAEGVLRNGKRFESVGEIQSYVDKLVSSAWFRHHYPLVPRIKVKDGRGRTRAGGSPSGRFITMPQWSRVEAVVLHEVAHVVAPDDGVAWHGWEFCAEFLKLVRHQMGQEAHDKLKASFRQQKVRFTAPRTRNLTDEQRQVLRDRLAQVRQQAALVAATPA